LILMMIFDNEFKEKDYLALMIQNKINLDIFQFIDMFTES